MIRRAILTTLVLSAAVAAWAQPARFDDVVRNLRNPDPKIRLNSVRLLREARYPSSRSRRS